MPSDRPPTNLDERAAAPLPVEALAAPLEGGSPCGSDLGYDAAFQALQQAAEGKPERQYGAKIYPAEPPDWPAVRLQALALAERTRDLRLAVWLVRSEARVEGLVGAVAALKLLHALLERHWTQVHPVPDAADADDPTARLNVLFPLHHEAGRAARRAAALASTRGALDVRALELAYGRAEPLPGETVLGEEVVLIGVRAAQAANPPLAAAMQDGAMAALGIAKVLDERLGPDRSPELKPLVALMQAVATAGRRAHGAAGPAVGGTAPLAGIDLSGLAPSLPAAQGEIRSRDDAVRALGRVCDWLEQNEPTHPAPILIARAQRLLAKKNFLEVIRDLMPDGIGQIEKLAGPKA